MVHPQIIRKLPSLLHLPFQNTSERSALPSLHLLLHVHFSPHYIPIHTFLPSRLFQPSFLSKLLFLLSFHSPTTKPRSSPTAAALSHTKPEPPNHSPFLRFNTQVRVHRLIDHSFIKRFQQKLWLAVQLQLTMFATDHIPHQHCFLVRRNVDAASVQWHLHSRNNSNETQRKRAVVCSVPRQRRYNDPFLCEGRVANALHCTHKKQR